MKILTGSRIREADLYTIEHEPIASIELMERASASIAGYLAGRFDACTEFAVFAGKGNNGGDGLAVARLLSERGHACLVYTLFPKEEATGDYLINLERLPESIPVLPFTPEIISDLPRETVLIDALLGTGVSGPAREPVAEAIRRMNSAGCRIVSIDLPSGMSTEFGNTERAIVCADLTLTLQFPKLALLLPEAGEFAGEIVVLPIGLDGRFIAESLSSYYFTTETDILRMLPVRDKFAHKNTYGHALLVCGSEGMIGAAVLSTAAALRSGCGLVTTHVPHEERAVIHISNPSALVDCDKGKCFTEFPRDLGKYTAVGIGCGMGQAPETFKAFRQLLCSYTCPIVIDADALNLLASHPELRPHIPVESILTPHIGELKRLVGIWKNEEEKFDLIRKFTAEYHCYMVVKGAHSAVCSPSGDIYFNPTGNAGMAKGGSGDVLTGLLTGLLARGIPPHYAAILGVYLHGKAGDEAAKAFGQEAMNAKDIADAIRFGY